MNASQFYRSSELVTLIHENVQLFGGLHPGYRAVHAHGRVYAGAFTATPRAQSLSRAAHLQGGAVPVTARFSYSSGDPAAMPGRAFAVATKFYLPDGTTTDLVAITLPLFPAGTADEVIELLRATRPDPATGRPDAERFTRYVSAHPLLAHLRRRVESAPVPASFAEMRFRPLHAFRFVNAEGAGRWAKYHWEPVAASGTGLPDLSGLPQDHLYDELEARLRHGPVAFALVLQLARDDDPLDDVSVEWPDDRERVAIGRLELLRPITADEIGDRTLLHDPTRVTDGIEVCPSDEIMAIRRGAYLKSVAERTGGWQREASCPFRMPNP